MKKISLLMLWMDVHVGQQSNLKLLMRKTYNNSLIQQTELGRTGCAQETESGELNR